VRITPQDLARLLKSSGHQEAATAVEAQDADLDLSEGRRGELAAIYRVRARIQSDAGRPRLAAEIDAFVDALAREQDERVYIYTAQDEVHNFVIFLDGTRRKVIAALAPPRGPQSDIEPAAV
jgi:GH25 family lysozyme M1 (1,4-beta-N-acetylmuramidase)